MGRKKLVVLGVFLMVFLGWPEAHATVLDFGTLTPAGLTSLSNQVTPHYGDNVTSTSDIFGTYGIGSGFTPHITTSYYTPGHLPMTTKDNYSGMTVLGPGRFSLIAAPGYSVTLNSFDVGTDVTLYGGPGSFFDIQGTEAHVLARIIGVGFTNVAPTKISPHVTDTVISIDLSDHFGINNVNFSEVDWSVPVPGAVWLFGSGLLGLVGWRRFRKG